MNSEIKQRWVDALRSGEYRQGHHQLRDEHPVTKQPTYCCLGVLCEIARQDGVVELDADIANTYVSTTDPSDRSDVSLPDAVVEWAGIPTSFGNEVTVWGSYLDAPRMETLLTCMNDSWEYTFDQISGVIDEQL